MKKIALSLAIASPVLVQAETINLEIEKPEFYGKINVTQEFVQPENSGNFSQLNSNASRLGVKGKIALEHGLKGIYQAEYETFQDDGEKAAGQTFSQRNTFIGIEGGFGRVQAGMFDTPFKNAQNKVDLFNDLQGDIKNIISKSENRSKNSVQYTSPSFAGLVATVDHLNSEDEDTNNGLSASLAYTRGDIYVAYAYDNEVNGEKVDAQRVVGQYKVGAVQLGALWETLDTDGNSEEGWMASAAFKATSAVTVKAQYGASDIKKEGGVSYSLGADYKLAKNAKTFVYATSEESDDESVNAQYYGAGLEYKF
ncbi:porin [Thalassolituus sp. C2-1]|uniref:porin n=1 Tax=Venatorbacter sp. C2-1 TaxID=2597518 RepID=UPI00119534C8|nr:porin [Thalassolituus sp. C2-1]TVV44723.1 porin [Thalassolituus sp. C2-1]